MKSMIDARNSQSAIKKRYQNITQDLKIKIEERDNDAIINFIEREASSIKENFKVNTHSCIPRVIKHLSSSSSVLFFSWPFKMTRRLFKLFSLGAIRPAWPHRLEKMTAKRDIIQSLSLSNMISKPAWIIYTSMGTGYQQHRQRTGPGQEVSNIQSS